MDVDMDPEDEDTELEALLNDSDDYYENSNFAEPYNQLQVSQPIDWAPPIFERNIPKTHNVVMPTAQPVNNGEGVISTNILGNYHTPCLISINPKLISI